MKKGRKFLAILLTVCMVVTLCPVLAMAGETPQFADMPDDWSTAALDNAVKNGLIKGYDSPNGTLIKANGTLTRAEMATVVNRAFAADKQASLTGVKDVAQADWFAPEIAKAIQMGTMKLSDTMRPNDNITRQEAFTILARAFKLECKDAGYSALNAFGDKAMVADWAAESLCALVEAGYVSGAGGMLTPTANITRAEFAKIMDNMVKQYITEAGTVTSVTAGNIIINVPGVILDGITISGNLILGDGIGEGNVTLNNVKVTGDTIVRGGGINSIIIKGDSDIGKIIIGKVDGNVRVAVEGNARVEIVVIEDGKDDVIVEGTVATLEVAAEVPVLVQNAKIEEVVVTEPDADLTVGKGATVNSVETAKEAVGAKLEVEKGATVTKVNAAAEKTEIVGDGKVETVNVTGDNVKVDTAGTKTTVAAEASGTIAGAEPVAGGTTITTEGTVPTPTGGGGGGHSHSYNTTDWMYDETNHWHGATCGHDVISGEAAHSYEGEGKVCTVCGYSRTGGAIVTTGTKSTTYETLVAAIGAATNDSTVKLLENVTLTETIVYKADKKITLDLNGHTISKDSKPFSIEQGNFIVTGSGIIQETSDDQFAPIYIKGSKDKGDKDYTTVTIGQDVTLKGWSGVFITPYKSETEPYAYGVVANINGTIVSPAAESHETAGYGVYINGQIQHDENCPIIEIGEKAKIDATGHIIYAAGYANWTINGGKFEGNSGIEIKAGVMTINGGTFEATGSVNHEANSNGASASGYVLAVVENEAYGDPVTVTVDDGDFTGPIGILDDDDDTENNDGKIVINGGKFDDMSAFDYLVESSTATIVANEGITVDQGEYDIKKGVTFVIAEGVTFTAGEDAKIINDGIVLVKEGGILNISDMKYGENEGLISGKDGSLFIESGGTVKMLKVFGDATPNFMKANSDSFFGDLGEGAKMKTGADTDVEWTYDEENEIWKKPSSKAKATIEKGELEYEEVYDSIEEAEGAAKEGTTGTELLGVSGDE